MSALLQKMLKARERRVTVGAHTFVVRRPTPLEYEEKMRGGNVARSILDFIVGWEGVTEGDLVSGGDPHPLAFDQAACAEWVSDRPDIFEAIAKAIVDGFSDRIASLESSLKN